MKESRFIELLNLYVDQQLSPEEASELEAELASDPSRKKTYQQYCRIQRGCTLLFEKERVRAPVRSHLAASLAEADRKIVEFPNRGASRKFTYASLGGLAAAACIAFVVVGRSPPSNGGAFASTENLPQTSVAASEIPSGAALAGASETRLLGQRSEFYSVIPTRHLMTLPEAEADRLAADAAASRIASYSWMRDLELQPVANLSLERITLQGDSIPAGTQQSRELRPRTSSGSEATEMTAFEFRR